MGLIKHRAIVVALGAGFLLSATAAASADPLPTLPCKPIQLAANLTPLSGPKNPSEERENEIISRQPLGPGGDVDPHEVKRSQKAPWSGGPDRRRRPR